jgi:LacI family transcriptional regulator
MFIVAMATIKEVARRARVSVGTVSNVLSGAIPVSERLKQRVLDVVRELDYHPNHVARSLKLRQTKMLGLVVSDITNPFFPQMVRGAEDAAWKHNYILITFNSDDRQDRERQLLSALRTRRVDGILLVAAATEGDLSHIQSVMEAGIPIVAVDRALKALPVDSLTVDNVAGAQECVHHLIECGHRRIGIITGPPHLPVARDRLEGYQRALAAASLPFDPALVRDGGFRAEGGYRAAMELLSAGRPTAIFTSNAVMALGVLRALNEMGLESPRDVAVATFDDPPFGEAVKPQLTSVAQPSYDLGYKGVELLLRRINEPNRKRVSQVLKTELKVRASTEPRRNATERGWFQNSARG